jgi:phosphatidylglycerol---prolipoprotein diacylglyceryl transferase
MLIHPQPDPVAIAIGPLQVHWYGLMYMLAFLLFIVLGRLRLRQPHMVAQGWRPEHLDDMLFFGVLGVVLGGRLGEVFFYDFARVLNGYYFSNPLEIIAVWKGGMSYHGGFLGVLLAMRRWCHWAMPWAVLAISSMPNYRAELPMPACRGP